MSSPDLRASDADRERVATELREQLAAGRLTLDELSERLDAAYRARTLGELEELTRDLPATGPAPLAVSTRSPTRWSVAIMGGVNRTRRWRVSERTNAISIMGGADIVLPEGLDVDVSGFALMGGKHESIADVPILPGAPRIRVRVFGLMGGVSVRTKRARRQDGLVTGSEEA